MCVSAKFSFGVAAALVPAGAFCLRAAARKAPRYAILAATPALFGVQQMAEGAVWVGLSRGDTVLTDRASRVFLLFALGLWPLWFAAAALAIETRPRALRLLGGWAALSSAWFWLWCWPLVAAPPDPPEARVVGHSIRYEYADRMNFGARAAYLVTGAVPMLVLPDRRRYVLLVALAPASAAVSLWLYGHAFTSVWCFLGAVASGYLVWLFARLPSPVEWAPSTAH
jgi:hypothetical protein